MTACLKSCNLQFGPARISARPKMRAGGRPPTEKLTVQSVCNCWNSRGVRSRHQKSRVRWHMIIRVVLSIIAQRRAQSVAGSISRKIREKDATGSRKKRLSYVCISLSVFQNGFRQTLFWSNRIVIHNGILHINLNSFP